MSIDLSSEQPITLAEAARSVPGRVHVSTIWRWVQIGVRQVRLETICCGGRRFTTREAIQRFFAATTAVSKGHPPVNVVTMDRSRQVDAAEQELDKEGI